MNRKHNSRDGKPVGLPTEGIGEEELKLVAQGKMRLPKKRLSPKRFSRMPIGIVAGNKAVEALLADREEGL